MTQLALALLMSLPSPAPVQLAVTELRGAGVPKETLEFLAEHLAARLRVAGFGVVTQREIASILGLERQKLLLGCEVNNCVAELASALGATGVLAGDVGHFGEVYQVNLKVLSGVDASVLGFYSEQVGSERAVLDSLDRGARQLSRDVHQRLGRPLPAGVVDAPPLSSRAWLPAVGGLLFAAGGAVLLGLAGADYTSLTTPGAHLQAVEATGLANGGALKRGFGVAAVSVGGAALVTALVMLLAGSSGATIAIMPTNSGAVAVWTGVFQ